LLLFENDFEVAQHVPQEPIHLAAQLDVAKLNISNRSRVSRLPWKGQFSPELIDYFLEKFAHPDALVVDPFCGSGTVLFESQERGLRSAGVDANPAAYLLSRGSSLARLDAKQREALVSEISAAITNCPEILSDPNDELEQRPLRGLAESLTSEESRLLLTIALMLGVGDKKILTKLLAQKGIGLARNFLADLPFSSINTEVHLGDARYLPDHCKGADLIVTSPPYINVFNYHQNYRPILELLGWEPLKAASTEIGANRKHRQNRLLTVIQYCIDMQLAFEDMARVMVQDGTLVLVVGRSSSVLGNTFYNADLLHDLLERGGGFDVRSRQTRVFKNRFGEDIFEEVLVARRVAAVSNTIELGRSVAVAALNLALQESPQQSNVLLEDAVANASRICPSPRLHSQSPLQ
jgi:SAM-dependent methyltransferase